MKPAKHPDQSQKNNDTLQGWIPEVADPTELVEALDKAFDYRGDVTITRKSGAVVEGYIFDRRRGKGLGDSTVRMMPRDTDGKVMIPFADIARVEFSGKDAAHGKSWENWIKRYVQKKMAGEKASIESESLED
ncbi:MAG: hypothetical protein GC162_07310 [Planctomycetes bacterium]|nr:hypothetical protein [Planctomycetota bacterium]